MAQKYLESGTERSRHKAAEAQTKSRAGQRAAQNHGQGGAHGLAGVVRKPAVAGAFYQKDAKKLAEMVDSSLAEVPERKPAGRLMGFVAPHAGYIYSGPVAAQAYSLLKCLDQKKEWKIIILGPSHQFYFQGAAASCSSEWETPLGKVRTDERKLPVLAEAHAQEHSIEVQLPFLQRTLPKFTITPIVFGEIDAEELADIVEPRLGEDTIVIASSDLSHYYPYLEAVKLDAVMNNAVPALDIGTASRCEACGLTGILALMRLAKRHKWRGEFIGYRNSGDTAGSMDQVVGYGAYAFWK